MRIYLYPCAYAHGCMEALDVKYLPTQLIGQYCHCNVIAVQLWPLPHGLSVRSQPHPLMCFTNCYRPQALACTHGHICSEASSIHNMLSQYNPSSTHSWAS